MRYREVLSILKEMEEKQPDALDMAVECVLSTEESRELDLTLTLGAKQRLLFVPAFDYEERNNGG